jgi:hypothetical protein
LWFHNHRFDSGSEHAGAERLWPGNLVNNVVGSSTDDISLARSRAISDRCTVYVLFVSTNIIGKKSISDSSEWGRDDAAGH